MARIVHVSDSHLTSGDAVANANWDSVSAYVRRTKPDLVVHTGDISMDGTNERNDLAHARRRLDELQTPWVAVPGNHDIGEQSGSVGGIDDARVRRYRDMIGATYWSVDVGGWTLVGVDSQTLLHDRGSETEEQWEWLEHVLDGDVPTVLFTHRPLMPWRDGELDDDGRYFTAAARARMTKILERSDVRLVGSGHVHQWRSDIIDRRAHVWVPSTWATLPDEVQPLIGWKVVGLVEHRLDPDGRSRSALVPLTGLSASRRAA